MLFKNWFKKRTSSIILEARKIVDAKQIAMCKLCEENSSGKRRCKEYCLPSELLNMILSSDNKEEMINNIDKNLEILSDGDK
jgi:hypothetical protein